MNCRKQLISKNLTCTVAISPKKAEFIQFLYNGGTKFETFEDYFKGLVQHLNQ